MRAPANRAWTALCNGRSAAEVTRGLAGAVVMSAVLWACACALLALEPMQ